MAFKIKSEFLVKHKIHILLFFLVIVISLLFFNRYYQEELGGDASGYWHFARQIAENPLFIINSPDFGQLEPVHNVIIGLIYMLPGNPRINLAILQILSFFFILIILYNLSLEFGSTLFAFLVVFWTLTSYRFYVFIWNPARDIWVFFFVTILFYFAYRYFQKTDMKNLVFFALIAGIVLLTDMRYFAHIGLLGILFLFIPSISAMQKVKRTGLLCVIIMSVIFPWIYRQYQVFGEWMFISKFRCEMFTKFLNKDKYKSTIHYSGEQKSIKRSIAYLEEQVDQGNLDRELYEKLMRRDQYYFKNKGVGILVKTFEFWRPFNFGYFMMPLVSRKSIRKPWSLQHNLDGILHIGILFPFFLVGVFQIFRIRNLFLIMLTVMIAGHTIMHVLTYVQERYRLIIIPYFFIIGFYGLFYMINYFRNKYISKK
jgi:hypothetical protein